MKNCFPVIELQEIATIKGGKRVPKGKEFSQEETNHPYIRARDIKEGRITSNDPVYLPSEIAGKLSRYTVSKGDICITIVGANVGDVGVVPQFLDGANLTENAVKVIAQEGASQAFLKYALLTKNAQDQMKVIAGGAAQPKLGIYKVETVEIPYPPYTTQIQIAAILSSYDDLIENNVRRIKILEEMAQNIYREWFVNFRFPGHQKVRMMNSPLGKIPEGWEMAEFRSIFDIKYGKTLPKTEISEKGLYPVYGAGDVIGYYDKFICQEKCALVTSRGNGSGTVWRTRETAFVTNNSLIIMPKKDFRHWDYSFVELFLKHSNVMEAKTGSAQPQVTIENLNYVKGIVPQRKTVEAFTVFSSPVYEQVDLIFKKNQNLRQTRDLLLPKLISGELDLSEMDITIPEAKA